jgi:hypothetical protein
MAAAAPSRPIYFLVTLWGATYADYFLDFCLASLLAPANIPALVASGWRCRLAVCAPPADVAYLKTKPLFAKAVALAPADFLEFSEPAAGESKMLAMSRGHAALTSHAHRDRAFAVFLSPDMIVSANAMACVARAAQDGVKALLLPAIRYAHEAVLERLAKDGIRVGGVPLAVPERQLAALGLACPHSETLRYEFDRPWFATFPISVYWRTRSAMVLHTFSWWPMLLDYGALGDAHDQSTFEHWTLDGDYLHRNLELAGARAHEIRAVTDSDDLMLITLTKESDLSFELKPHWAMRGALAHRVAIAYCFRHPSMDPLKRRLFPAAALIHAGALDPELSALREKARAVIERSIGVGAASALGLLLIVLDRRTYAPILDRHAPSLARLYRRVRNVWRRLLAPAPG